MPQFVMKYLNMMPKEAHDADFARIKPWYLDGQYVLMDKIQRLQR